MPVKVVSNDSASASPTIRDIDGFANEFIYTYTPLSFSGSYTTGGDTLDLTPIIQAGVPGGIAQLLNATIEGNGPAASLSANGGFYDFVKGAALTNCKVKPFANSAGSVSEYSAGAYGTDVTTDLVMLICTWRKFQ